MPNIALLLKNEIARVARKEVKAETQGLRKTVGPYRNEIAALKRRVQDVERQLRQAERVARKASPAKTDDTYTAFRFSAKGLANHRKRLGLSAADCGKLIGASSLSVYKWEKGQTRPRAKHIAAIAQLRKMGKKEAAANVAQF